ncbi:MAG: ATP synthase F0 subunit C [Firmicutes bacterium]|nr:ATP synthase F0 subunit C [Bacillota bacterium]
MKSMVKKLSAVIMLIMVLFMVPIPVSAAEAGASEAAEAVEADTDSGSSKAWAAAVCVGLPAAVATIGMAWAISKSSEGISRQPEADGKIRTSLMLGLVFIETAIIYALIIAILIIFVL